jgi:hypothetical protein
MFSGLRSSQSENIDSFKMNVLPLGTASSEAIPSIARKRQAKQDGYALFFNLKSITNRTQLLLTAVIHFTVRSEKEHRFCWKVPRLHPFVLLIKVL